MKMWVTYFRHYQHSGDPRESGTTSYSKVALFDQEIEALRYANEAGAKCVPILPQETLEDAIKRSRV